MHRVLEIVTSIVLLCLLGPIILLIALVTLVIKRETPFFKQKRVGRNEVEFYCWKLKSVFTTNKGGEKLPSYGLYSFLRRIGVDEFPQLFNILRGDMSFIGPRPLIPEEYYFVKQHIPNYSKRSSVRPGIIGLAQAYGYRGFDQFSDKNIERSKLDNYYCDHRSLRLDLYIVLKTAKLISKIPKK